MNTPISFELRIVFISSETIFFPILAHRFRLIAPKFQKGAALSQKVFESRPFLSKSGLNFYCAGFSVGIHAQLGGMEPVPGHIPHQS